ncbi:MAG: GNAT family N-acetyltransferase [Elusimicrobiota bacterium]|nr:MAG: GNAT family N-acetyltransferase [Elusimicrobiota bacterium]
MDATTLEKTGLITTFARTIEDVRDAQRLRWTVFAGEMGARLSGPEGLDADGWDAQCLHVLVREPSGRVVACLRALDQDAAAAAGGFYSQSEFDLSRFLSAPGRILEVGRTCVAADRRDGATLSALWSGLARAAVERGAERLIGCVSVPFDPETQSLDLLRAALADHLSGEEHRVWPLRPVPRGDERGVAAGAPPLLRAYLRLGAKVCGEPSWDPDFGTADFFVVVPVERMAARYGRRFLGGAKAAACA